jgi:hypothetical protein
MRSRWTEYNSERVSSIYRRGNLLICLVIVYLHFFKSSVPALGVFCYVDPLILTCYSIYSKRINTRYMPHKTYSCSIEKTMATPPTPAEICILAQSIRQYAHTQGIQNATSQTIVSNNMRQRYCLGLKWTDGQIPSDVMFSKAKEVIDNHHATFPASAKLIQVVASYQSVLLTIHQ